MRDHLVLPVPPVVTALAGSATVTVAARCYHVRGVDRLETRSPPRWRTQRPRRPHAIVSASTTQFGGRKLSTGLVPLGQPLRTPCRGSRSWVRYSAICSSRIISTSIRMPSTARDNSRYQSLTWPPSGGRSTYIHAERHPARSIAAMSKVAHDGPGAVVGTGAVGGSWMWLPERRPSGGQSAFLLRVDTRSIPSVITFSA